MEIKECHIFSQWVINARPNDKYIYFKGFSLTDTFISLELQKLTFSLALKGTIYLVQQKLKVHNYNFIAIKSSLPPNPRLVPFQKEEHRVKRPYKRRLLPTEHLEIHGMN